MSIYKRGQIIKIYANNGYHHYYPAYIFLINRKETIPNRWKGSNEVWWAMDIQKGDKFYYRLDSEHYTAEVINNV